MYKAKIYEPIACLNCGGVFTPKRSDTRYCGPKCQQRARYAANPYNPETFGTGTTQNRGKKQDDKHVEKRMLSTRLKLEATPKKCLHCGEEFIRTTAAQRFCSGRCWNAADRAKPNRRRWENRIRLHPDHLAELHRIQNNKCGICGVEGGVNNRGDRLAVDHCHEGNYIRGLLCHKCNTAIGLLGDSEANLLSAIEYLKTARSRAKTFLEQ